MAIAWAIPVTFLPILLARNSVPSLVAITIAIFWLLRSLISVETCNVPDVSGDRAKGIATLSTRYGISKTQLALYGLDMLPLLPLIVLAYVSSPAVPVVVLLPVLGYSTACTYLLQYRQFHYFIATATDTQYLLMTVLVFMVSQF